MSSTQYLATKVISILQCIYLGVLLLLLVCLSFKSSNINWCLPFLGMIIVFVLIDIIILSLIVSNKNEDEIENKKKSFLILYMFDVLFLIVLFINRGALTIATNDVPDLSAKPLKLGTVLTMFAINIFVLFYIIEY